jgi:hypothetical protein
MLAMPHWREATWQTTARPELGATFDRVGANGKFAWVSWFCSGVLDDARPKRSHHWRGSAIVRRL